MKRILISALLLLFFASFMACQTTTSTTTSQNPTSSETSTTTSSTTTSTTTTTTTSTTTSSSPLTTRTYKENFVPIQGVSSYCDEIEFDHDFIIDKIASMSLAEKVGQMLQAERNGASAEDVKNYNLGSILSGGGSAPSNNQAYYWYLMVKGYYQASLSSSSQIPILYGVDAVHGHNNVKDATIFPHNIGLGAANDPSLMERIGIITSREVRVTGINYTFAPAVSVVQNPAWGRTYESFSEDPDIVSNLAQHYLNGLQNYCMTTSAKHFVADGGTFNGVDQGNAILDELTVRELHLKPYYNAIASGVSSIMASYSSINGQKMHGSHYWLTDVLKTEMGFLGFVISDYNAIQQLSGDYYQQIVTAVNAGIDMLMEPFRWKEAIEHLLTAAQNGDIAMNRIDDAVYRILRIKYLNGLFHDDFYDEVTGEFYRLTFEEGFATNENKNVAREAVRKSLVLLKNENNALPLSKTQPIAILGEGARNVGLQSGGWTISWQGEDNRTLSRGTTLYQGLRQVLASTGTDLFEQINQADTVIVVLSEKPYAEYNGDNLTPTLIGQTAHSGNQAALEQAMLAKSLGKKVIGILYSGRPMILDPYLAYFDAFIAAWLPGSEAGLGISDLIFGDYQFQGKLPITWPKSTQGLGMNSNKEDYNSSVVLFPIHFGLIYEEE